MAIYINLGIDCGTSGDVADAIEAHFRGFRISLREVGDVECEVSRTCRGGFWFIGVWPRGLGYATPTCCRPELRPRETEIGAALYRHLSLVSGYRRAMFGGEAYDVLWDWRPPEELNDIEYEGMVYAESEFPSPPPGWVARPFRPGYVIASSRPE